MYVHWFSLCFQCIVDKLRSMIVIYETTVELVPRGLLNTANLCYLHCVSIPYCVHVRVCVCPSVCATVLRCGIYQLQSLHVRMFILDLTIVLLFVNFPRYFKCFLLALPLSLCWEASILTLLSQQATAQHSLWMPCENASYVCSYVQFSGPYNWEQWWDQSRQSQLWGGLFLLSAYVRTFLWILMAPLDLHVLQFNGILWMSITSACPQCVLIYLLYAGCGLCTSSTPSKVCHKGFVCGGGL